jgi:DNA-binding HxlR family transcriptional regulator
MSTGARTTFISVVVCLIIIEYETPIMVSKGVKIELSDDLKEEMRKLKEEMAGLKQQLRDMAGKERESRGIHIDVGDRVHDYIEDVMEGVAEGIHGELEKSIFIGPKGVRIISGREAFREGRGAEVNFPRAVEAMSALGQEHRLRILKELMSGGKYINELQEKLSEITTSTLSSHLKVLEDAGLVVQEKVRGRYLITMPGRVAYEMARRVARFLERRDQE